MKSGDIVVRVDGKGQQMTVERVELTLFDSSLVHCVWFVSNNVRRLRFWASDLVIVK